jgi:hypothetical protein
VSVGTWSLGTQLETRSFNCVSEICRAVSCFGSSQVQTQIG